MNSELLEQLSRMVQGHEIWLENPTVKEGEITVELSYGHNMVTDGVPPEHMVNPVVYSPNGSRFKPQALKGEDCYIIHFPAHIEGNYTLLVDSSAVWNKNPEGWAMGPKFKFKDVTYSGSYHQMAKKIVPVGKVNGLGVAVVHGILELIPEDTSLVLDKTFMVQVLYEGRPLANESFKAYSKRNKKENMLTTDANGKVQVPIDHEGEWMFLVRHRDETKKVDEEYDETVFVTTLVMETR
ncbi:MAG: Nickel uptake substrate-specific transmembrane region [Methanomassiliicoccales archaeon PtaU1.Bin030]|nr:MAG: Nickel uptake substrate-specific transmembrane region [Methanomassiliicoccales archaeon PtaU1.Bin030]